jgi:DNA-binding NtrC family response regulator
MSAHCDGSNSVSGVPTDSVTLPEDEGPAASSKGPPDVLALVVVWSADEPWRVGQAAILPPGEPGPHRVFGRGAARADAPHRRVELARHRPGGPNPCPPIASPTISRLQLILRAIDDRTVEVSNVGRATLLHHGVPTVLANVTVGDSIQLGSQMLLLCIRRPAWLSSKIGKPDFAFGREDDHGMVGESGPAWRLREQIAFIAGATGHVLILGSSGSGKELVANAIHAISPAGRHPMVSRNAATLPETLIDAELFGNAKNYPNPGMLERPGLIGQADDSTLFLDEIAELSPSMQAHLLRVLDQGEYQRLGDAKVRRSRFRLVAASNRSAKDLKHDLLARFNLRIELPSLNARREDVPLLVHHLLRRMARDRQETVARFFTGGDPAAEPRVSLELMRRLVHHPYSSNVREVEAFLWKAVARSGGDSVGLWEDLDAPPSSAPARRVSMGPTSESAAPLQLAAKIETHADADAVTRKELEACLRECGGVQEKAWRVLGLSSRHALSRLMAKHGLHVPRSRRYR